MAERMLPDFPLRPVSVGIEVPSGQAVPKRNSAVAIASPGESANKSADPATAARDFEALLIGQMLRSAHSSEEQQDATGDTMWDMAAQQFARVLADNGGLGLARIITQGLAKREPPLEANEQVRPAVAAAPPLPET